MRFFVGGPRVMGLRTGVIFSPADLVGRRSLPGATARNFVYVVRGEHGAAKIGVTTSPAARIAQLRTGSHVPLEFVGLAACSGDPYQIEEMVHRVFRRHRLAGEWFDVDPGAAMQAIREAAKRLGQTLTPADPGDPFGSPPPHALAQEDRAKAHLNMKLVAFAAFCALCVVFALYIPKV